MSNYILVPLVMVISMINFWVGYGTAENKYQEQLLEVQAKNELVLKQQKETDNATISLLIQGQSKDSSVNTDVNNRVSRVQYNLNSSDRKLLKDSIRASTESIRECRKLLSEGSGLLGEGNSLLRETNRRLETFINLTKEQ